MLPLAYFGIESSGLNLVIDLLILFIVVLYLSLIYWTYADARRRIADPMLVGCATAASLFPFVGTIIYLILRPPEYLQDARERELEMQAAEARLHELGSSLCPHCDYPIERDFIRCPSCLRKLKDRCVACQRPLDQAWTICPYCETEVPGAIAPPRRRRRRRGAEEEDQETAVATEVRIEPETAAPSARERSARRESARSARRRDSALDGETVLGGELALDGGELALGGEDDPLGNGLPAMTATGEPDPDESRAKPVAAPGRGSSGSRGTGRARRPRSAS